MHLTRILALLFTSSHLIIALPSASIPFKGSACAYPGQARESAYNMRIPLDLIAETYACDFDIQTCILTDQPGDLQKRCMRSAMTTARFDAGCAVMLWGWTKEAEQVGMKLGEQARGQTWVADSKRLCEEWVVGRMDLEKAKGGVDGSVQA